MADHKEFELEATKSKVNFSGQFFCLEYDVPLEETQVIRTYIENGVEKGYFYLGLQAEVPLLNFIVEVLTMYSVAPSQL